MSAELIPFGPGIVRKIITEANTAAMPFDLDWCERSPMPDGYFESGSFFESIPDFNEAIVVPSGPRDCSNLASTTFSRYFGYKDLRTGHVEFVSADLRDTKPAQAASSTPNAFFYLSKYYEQLGIDESLRALDSITTQMKNLIPLSRSSNLVELAKRAVAGVSSATREDEDVEAWAHKLASDVKDTAD